MAAQTFTLKQKISDSSDGEPAEYTILDKSTRPRGNRKYARPLGEGGGGAVYRAYFKGMLPRAIKILSSTDESHEDSYRREFDHLVDLRHPNIVNLIDYGRYLDPATKNKKRTPFLVMDLVEGGPLCTYDKKTEKFSSSLPSSGQSGRVFLRLISQLVDATSYLHSQRVMHGDIKGENILVSGLQANPDDSAGSLDRCQATLLDLGSAHTLEGSRGVKTDMFRSISTEVFFNSSPRIAHPDHKDYCNTWMARSALVDLHPYYDLHAIGVLLRELLKAPGVDQWLKTDLGADTLEAIEVIRDRLLESPDDPFYRDVSELARDWARLDRNTLSPAGVPELTRTSQLRRTVFLPRESISTTERIGTVIDAPDFQRLRLLPQLDLVSLIHPGATHTRLLHSLATYETARLYAERLLNGSRFRLLAGPAEVTALLLIALLHDIGHYACLHFLEDYRADLSESGVGFIPSDDELFSVVFDPAAIDAPTVEPYANAWSEMRREQFGSAPTLAELVDTLFGKEVLAATRSLRSAIDGQQDEPSPVNLLLAPIVSSDLDADKLAYLADDSHFTGIPYGQGIDRTALIASLRDPVLSDLDGKGTLAIGFKGLAAAESVFIARQAMLRRVYWQHTNRSIMAMVHSLIDALVLTGTLDMLDLWTQLALCGTHDGLALLEERYLKVCDQAAHDLGYERTIVATKGLTVPWRRLHKRILSVPAGPDPIAGKIYDTLVGLGVRGRAKLVASLAQSVADRLDLGENTIQYGEILLDVPRKDRGPESDALSSQVLVYQRGGEAHPLPEVSSVVRNLGENYRVHAKKVRLFATERLAIPLRTEENQTWLAGKFRKLVGVEGGR